MKASRYTLPPAGPSGFDARFTSGRMVETYPAILEKGKQYDYMIALTGELPVVVKWSGGKDNGTSALVLKSQPEGKILAVLTGSGTVTLTEKEVTNKGLVSVGLVESMGIPHEFALGQNYPNPFNPVTRFQVDVPYQSTVEVSIYDVLGRKIATLMQGVQDAGYHTMEWNGHDGQGLQVPTGMYFMRMTATVAGSGNEKDEQPFSSVRKIMLMK